KRKVSSVLSALLAPSKTADWPAAKGMLFRGQILTKRDAIIYQICRTRRRFGVGDRRCDRYRVCNCGEFCLPRQPCHFLGYQCGCCCEACCSIGTRRESNPGICLC